MDRFNPFDHRDDPFILTFENLLQKSYLKIMGAELMEPFLRI